MRIKYISTIILLCIRVCLNAQDIHFTQFTQSPLFTNPAMTGNFDGDFRLVGNFKNQWGNIPVPYNTVAGSFDANIASNIFGLGSLGLGVLMFNDDAGDSRLTTRSIQACAAYNKIVGKRKKSIFSFGFNIGYVFKGINTDKLRWDEQFNGDYFDPSIPMTEQLNRMTIHSIDLGAGVNYVNHYAKNSFYSFGIALQHINSSNQSFFLGGDEVKLQRKPMFTAATQFKIAKKTYLKPEMFYQWQDDKQEWVFGTLVKYYIKDLTNDRIAVMGGAYWRVGDSWVPGFRLEYNNLTLGFSYDINTSKLTTASNFNGGFEASIIYIIKYKKKKYPYNFCPFLWM